MSEGEAAALKRFICVAAGALLLIPVLLLGCTSPGQSEPSNVNTSTVTVTSTITVTVPAVTVTTVLTPPTATITETVTSTLPTVTITANTPTPTSSQQIVITYSGIIQNQIGTGDSAIQPPPGNAFLVVFMTIKNQGYDSFSVSPIYFSLIANNIKYSSSIYSYSLQNSLPSVDVLNGGSLTGSLAFEVPSSTTTYTVKYEAFKTYNIQLVKQ